VLADNKLPPLSGWDHELLAIELQALIDIDFDVELTGFSPAEIDLVLEDAREGSPNTATEAKDQIRFRSRIRHPQSRAPPMRGV
jgi:hypothetical protein